MIKQGIKAMSSGTKNNSYRTEYNGIFSLSGVIVNSRKEQNDLGVESNKLKNNKTLNNLAKIIGLKKGAVYNQANIS
jgi:hypothetical protein